MILPPPRGKVACLKYRDSLFLGLANFVPGVAYHFCLNLPGAFLQPGNGLLEIPCIQSQIQRFLCGCVKFLSASS